MSSNIARMVVESFQKNSNSPLTKRETQVLELLSKGKSYSVIADELFRRWTEKQMGGAGGGSSGEKEIEIPRPS